MAWRARLPRAICVTAIIIAVTVPILVGLSRIALGVHYPSDVLGGWLAGIAFVALGATLIEMTAALGPDPPAETRGGGDQRADSGGDLR